MKLIGKKKIEKYIRKNQGNVKLKNSVYKLIYDIEENEFKDQFELKSVRQDADLVHSEGFYFFDIENHRIMFLMEFGNEEATIV